MGTKSRISWTIHSSGIAILLLLLFAGLTSPTKVSGQSGQSSGSAKRPLTHKDYDSWRSLVGYQISRDGKYAAWSLIPQDGNGEIVVRDLAGGKEWRQPRGWRPPVPIPDEPEAAQAAIASLNRATRPLFTADSRYLLFTIEPLKEDVLKARKEKKKPEEMPKNALGILDLLTGQLNRIERVKTFQIPEEGIGYVACLLEAALAKPEDGGGAGSTAAAASGNSKKKEYGSDLILRELANGKDSTFADVLEFSFSKDGKNLLYTIASKSDEKNGLFSVTPGDTNSYGAPLSLLGGKGRYIKITWDENQKQLVFLSDRDDAVAGSPRPKMKLYYWNRQSGPAGEIVSASTPGFSSGKTLSEKASPSFARDGSRIFLGVTLPPEPEKDPAAEIPADEKVIADLWHWKDDYIQPMQKVRASQDRDKSWRAVWHIAEKRFTQLADETMDSITPSPNGLWAIGQDDRAYRRLVGVDTNYADVYLVNTVDGSRKQLLTRNEYSLSWSPNGKFAVYYDGKDWNSISVPGGKVTNLTGQLKVNFWDEEHDTPNTPPPYGIAGWTKEDQDLLIYDQYDIWQISPNDGSAKLLTNGLGRREKTALRYVRLDPEERSIDPTKPLLLRAEDQQTYDSGFYRIRIGGGAPERLLMGSRNYSTPVKAKNADVLLLTESRFDEFPDLHVTDSTFSNLKRVSDAGKQKDAFLWGKAELVSYNNTDGVTLSAVLIKPENFDPNKRYPLMVYIYEKLSDGLHRFVNPAPGTSINPSYYTSNGYVVLLPDIVYKTGYPGQSALNCVLPAVQQIVNNGYIDEKAIGIQGHSWGGYQIAYMVTQTNRFKAAAPGAVVGNMTSAYSGIRWGTGLPRQFQYERTQSRIGGSIWEYPLRFIENSPVFNAHRVQTPLLMVHNDNDDAVPWYQGIEYFLALRRLNKEVYMFNYNGEYHGLRRRPDQKDYTRRLQEFFDYNLKGASKPEWMEKGIPYLEREREKEKYR